MKSSEIRLQQFGRALGRLQEALDLPHGPVVRDACIQRFEFTFETAWKAIQADAFAEGTECASPRDCVRTAFRLGVLDRHETDWLKMVEDRNRTSHTYDEETAEEIYLSLPRYSKLFEGLLGALQDRDRRRVAEESAGDSDRTQQ